MDAYATVEEYEARFGKADDEAILAECLADASAAIAAAMAKAGIAIDASDDDQADRLMRACRSVANRLVPSGVPAGVTQSSMSAGSFSESYSYGTSYGLPKLLQSELALLGIASGTGRSLRPRMGFGDD